MNFFILKKVAFVIRIGFNWIAIKFTTVKLKLYNLCRLSYCTSEKNILMSYPCYPIKENFPLTYLSCMMTPTPLYYYFFLLS